MTTLSDHQFELLPTEAATDGVVFGIGADSLVEMADAGFIPGDDDWATDDQNDQFKGGIRFGRDVLNGPVHGFNLFTNGTDEADALSIAGIFKTAWRALSLRSGPSDVIPCRYRLNGRVRRFYGRPRRYSAPPDNLILSGYIPITTDFQAVDGFFYDDAEQTELLTMRDSTGDSGGGMIFPVIFPTSSLPIGSGTAQVVVGGDAPAYPILRIDGPVSNPRVETDDWSIQLTWDLPIGNYIEIDTRPWKRTVLLNGSSSLGGALAGYFTGQRHQSITDVVLNPGQTEVSFWGTAASGSPSCTVRWRNTYNSY